MFGPVYHFLERIGYPHPLHAPLTHMPIGLVTGALVFFLVARWFPNQPLTRAARFCLILAWLFLFPTVLFGIMDWQFYYAGAWLFYIKIKIILASLLFILLTIGLIVTRKAETGFPSLTIYTLSFVTVVLLGWFGGQLIFGNWTPVAPQEFQAGARIFKSRCSGCHPRGGNLLQPNLPVYAAPQLSDLDTFQAFVRHPTMPNGSI